MKTFIFFIQNLKKSYQKIRLYMTVIKRRMQKEIMYPSFTCFAWATNLKLIVLILAFLIFQSIIKDQITSLSFADLCMKVEIQTTTLR